jgi:uncharacterized damage-inducible protein DinB
MNLKTACLGIFSQLTQLINQLTEQDYTTPIQSLGSGTIGQHLRHTLEFFICLEKGCDQKVVNYDNRAHDKLIESDIYIALAALHKIQDFIVRQESNIPLTLEVGYDLHTNIPVTVQTNFQRELVYNIEHAVHHMAIIKIGLREIAPLIELPADFGIAASTVRYQDAALSATH